MYHDDDRITVTAAGDYRLIQKEQGAGSVAALESEYVWLVGKERTIYGSTEAVRLVHSGGKLEGNSVVHFGSVNVVFRKEY